MANPLLDIQQLVADHHQSVYRYAFRLTGSVGDAEDLTQQVFLIAQQKLTQVRNAESVSSWLFTVLRHCFVKTCQKRRPILAGSIDLEIENVPDDVPRAEEIDREQLQRALGELSDPHRLVVTMFYFENLSYKEIAEKLDLPIGTVMSRLARAKGHLRARLFQAGHSWAAQRPGTANP
jgi:RNA polymerase sigma-70 factor (ECF subfamily)